MDAEKIALTRNTTAVHVLFAFNQALLQGIDLIKIKILHNKDISHLLASQHITFPKARGTLESFAYVHYVTVDMYAGVAHAETCHTITDEKYLYESLLHWLLLVKCHNVALKRSDILKTDTVKREDNDWTMGRECYYLVTVSSSDCRTLSPRSRQH